METICRYFLVDKFAPLRTKTEVFDMSNKLACLLIVQILPCLCLIFRREK